ncbi:MAG: hypothetical protein PHX61_14360 [Alphaproteobacteria bacterium]|nr:hypothetical protein [Alphaproteobacteria bacterium]
MQQVEKGCKNVAQRMGRRPIFNSFHLSVLRQLMMLDPTSNAAETFIGLKYPQIINMLASG